MGEDIPKNIRSVKYADILKYNKELGDYLESNFYNIAVFSNITINQIKEICEYSLRTEGINAHVQIGDYNNIVQSSIKFKQSNIIVVFWEASNIINSMPFKIESLDDDQQDAILKKTKQEIDLLLRNLQKTPLILFNKFTTIQFSNFNIRENKYDRLVGQLNQYIENNLTANVRLVDLEKVIATVGVEKSLDFRHFYSSKMLYSVAFFKTYVEYIKPIIMGANGKAKKALIFDCDNTLWKGILGEDGFKNIEMSQETSDGAVFAEIQSIAMSLIKQGVLIGLCSKNNPEDVDEVIKDHPDMQLRDEDFTIIRSNWLDKVSNLKSIAQELNIGLDSMVVVDDSPFEVNLVREALPEITALQVPEELHKYPELLRRNIGLFYNLSVTAEDSKKVEIYKHQKLRESVKQEYHDIEDYFTSLGMKITICQEDESIIQRISQLTQKTNQFNLTTKRYTEGDIRNLNVMDNSKVIAFSVSDKFGDIGVTGVCIIIIDKSKTACIDTFLISCRIIGRNIEFVLMDYLINTLKDNGINSVKAKYIKTSKNSQVRDFYDKCSFVPTTITDLLKEYVLDINDYKPSKINYIEVING